MSKERNNKNYIDKELYGEIMTAMKRSGIPDAVFELARKMDMNLPKLFYEKVLNSKNSNDILSFSRNLLGIYGNYFAALHFKQSYANVKTEMPLYKENKLCTNVDISFTDENGVLNLCEVKTSPYIGFVTSYRDEMGNIINNNSSIEEMKKYRGIGDKLLKQVGKLIKYNTKVNVVVYDGTIISDGIDKVLNDTENKNISKIIIPISINKLEADVDDLIDKILENFNSKASYSRKK